MYQCADRFAGNNLLKVAGNIHIKDVDGQTVLLAHGSGGQVHHLEVAVVDLIKGYLIKLGGGGVFLRIGSIYAVHAGSLEHHIGLNLYAAQ